MTLLRARVFRAGDFGENTMQRHLRVWAGVLLALLTGGCGSNTVKVSGTVQDRTGKPVPAGTVTFFVEGGPPAGAEIVDGKYEAVNVAFGEAVVTVIGASADAPPPATTAKPLGRPDLNAAPLTAPVTTVPSQYADTSTTPLRFMVEKGDNTFNIKLH
jgi:hypothetical protein